jgi:hypothetical protein
LEKLFVIKIGGNVIDDEKKPFVIPERFCRHQCKKNPGSWRAEKLPLKSATN